LALTGDLTNLRATFNKSNTSVSLTDPAGTVFPAVRIAQLTVELAEARTDGTLLSYAHLILRESHDLTLTLDGSSYSYLPGTWQERRPHAASSHSAGAGHPEEEYEWAAAKREWEFTLLALSADLTTLRASFNKSLTILNFTDPLGSSLSGRFQDLLVELAEVRTDGTALYYAHCILRESILVTVPLDGNTYTLLPGSWQERRPRVSTAQLNRLVASGGSGVGERFTDSGPAKREWFFTAVCLAADVANLTASYEKVNTTLVWGDYNGTNRNVHFDDLVLELAEITTAAVDWFYAHCTLREA
ncbi:MAG: hypothetical protein JOZ41_02595, partial [Chloroflexi bacterium]|nr:hypothetical protein [Chloroflexota bacterium]